MSKINVMTITEIVQRAVATNCLEISYFFGAFSIHIKTDRIQYFSGYGLELLKHTKYFHTMPERFFTFRFHAQSVGMAVVGGGLTLGV